MILPKFSLRQALSLMLIVGVVSIVLASAWRGEKWALGQTAALVAALAVSLLGGLAYWLFLLIGRVLNRRHHRKPALAAPEPTLPREAKS